jgi:D-3-phosphoglycerate dehydrogenase
VSRPPTILVTESSGFSPKAAALLAEVGDPILDDLDRPGLVRAARNADVLWVRLRHRIDREVLDAAGRLRAVVTPTTGLNHIDLAECDRRGVAVLSLRGDAEFLRDVRATAEHTLLLMLAVMRSLPAAAAEAAGGGWRRDPYKGAELYEKTVGVVGYGRLGRIVAGYLAALGARVLVHDPHVDPALVAPPATAVGLTELLGASDVVTLHVALDERTRGFFGPSRFAEMRPGAWFVNTARGELVDEAALLDALASGRLAGAALDVLCDESSAGMAGNALVRYAAGHDNLVITPHIGGWTLESAEKTEVHLAKKLAERLRGGFPHRPRSDSVRFS